MTDQLVMQVAMVIAGVLALLIVCRYIGPLFEVTISTLVIAILLVAFTLMLGLSAVGVVVVVVGYLLYFAYTKIRYRIRMVQRGRRQR